MQYPGYNTGKVIFAEGKWFPFKLHNLVQLQDDTWYFVLKDINEMKHFMPAEHYGSYGFKPGDEISCKIDRINCTGRIYLEPKHPYYNEGEIYSFDLISYSEKDSNRILIVREIAGNKIEVPVCGNNILSINGEKNVRCMVKSIKKGIPILEISPDYL